ncbi:hypothetical protein HZA44_03105 [Candidatus Peregrinibacteria bacterium]|nr:hypothetical protein [Candidatus Peregrinibacteria bacterium]
MAPKTPQERAEFLLRETEERLQEIQKLNLEKAELEAQTEWLDARRLEIRNILTFAGEPDEEFQKTADERISALEKDAWGVGLHSHSIKTKKPSSGKL